MKTADFKEALDLVKPAIGSGETLVVFEHVKFDGDHITSFNSQVAIRAACAVKVDGTVPGPLLCNLINSLSIDTITVSHKKAESVVHIKSKKTLDINLPVSDPNDFPFEFPEDFDQHPSLQLVDNYLQGIERCLLSTIPDQTEPRYMGITAVIGPEIIMFGADNDTISRFETREGDNHKDQDEEPLIILPTEFCKSVLAAAKSYKGKTPGTLYMSGNYAVADYPEHCQVFARLVADDNPTDFDNVISDVLSSNDFVTIPIPKGLDGAIERAGLIAEECTLTIDSGVLTVVAESSMGKVHEVLVLTTDAHPNMAVGVNPKLIYRAIPFTATFALVESAVVMSSEKGNYSYYVSVQ